MVGFPGVKRLVLTLGCGKFRVFAVLLALRYLDIKNIRIGPRLPAYMTPAVHGVLES